MTHHRTTMEGSVLLAVALSLTACGGGAMEGGEALRVPARYQGPVAPSADPSKGEAVFSTYCNGCHPGGQADMGPALAGRSLDPGRIRWIVRDGGDSMPAFPASKISDEDLEHLAAYVHGL